MTESITISVSGTPQPAGSKRAFAHRTTGRIVVTDANAKSRLWKTNVAQHAIAVMRTTEPLTGPLHLHIDFYMPRPQYHYGKHGVKPTAPCQPTSRPDLTKLIRGTEDALTGICWHDDAQIVEQTATKTYGDAAGCEITITEAA
jgi:Holliday junction resolvase RusA-like endonuclease